MQTSGGFTRVRMGTRKTKIRKRIKSKIRIRIGSDPAR